MTVFLPILTTSVTLIFAASVFIQYAQRRKTHQLVWAVSLVIYGLATASEVAAGIWGWNDFVYKSWYLFGAIWGVSYLGMGTLYLLAPHKYAHALMGLLLLASVYALYKVVMAPVDLTAALSSGFISGQGIPADIRSLTPFFNAEGTLILIGGAVYSSWVFLRKRILLYRVYANVLITVGILIVAAGGTLSRFGVHDLLYVFELVGITIVFFGFLKSREPAHAPAPAPKPMPRT